MGMEEGSKFIISEKMVQKTEKSPGKSPVALDQDINIFICFVGELNV